MTRLRPVCVIAAAVNVLCPHCGEDVPSPDGGSLMWTLEEDRAGFNGARRQCNGCEEWFIMSLPSRAIIEARPGEITNGAKGGAS